MALTVEYDIATVRQRTRQIASALGFNNQDQTRIATAVSEIARNTINYASKGNIRFILEGKSVPQTLLIEVQDKGPGIDNLPTILAGNHKSSTGMGLGITGARRLMDRFEIESQPDKGTRVLMGKQLSRSSRVIGNAEIAAMTETLLRAKQTDPIEEIRQQNRELMVLLEELRQRQEELTRTNQELEETNRGIVALHAELEDKNRSLENASRLKSQFLANMSHELRTPMNSIIGFTGIILKGLAGDLNDEQIKQLNMVYNSARHLLSLINDILDLSKIEAGKIDIYPTMFKLTGMLETAEKMMRPLIEDKQLKLVIEVDENIPETINGDHNRIRQILLNLLSNAVKFTEHGTITVTCKLTDEGSNLLFGVKDSGIGIGQEDQDHIFDEFSQIEDPHQNKPEGTGLGLAISRRFVEMMGGRIWVESSPGRGSLFQFTIPLNLFRREVKVTPAETFQPDPDKQLVMVIDDELEAQEILKTYLNKSGYEVLQAFNALEALDLARKYQPFAITLDIIMPGKDGWDILKELKNDPDTGNIPVICISVMDHAELGLSLGAVDFITKPIDSVKLIAELEQLKVAYPIRETLIIDDDPEAVEIVSQILLETGSYRIRRAYGGRDGIAMAIRHLPDLIILDLRMPDVDGFKVIENLKVNPKTKTIPIIIVTAQPMTSEETDILNSKIEGIIRKGNLDKASLLKDIGDWLDRLQHNGPHRHA